MPTIRSLLEMSPLIENSEAPFKTGDELEVLQKGGDWWSEMKKGVILLVRDEKPGEIKVRDRRDVMSDSDGYWMKIEPGFKNKPGTYKLVGDRFRRTLMVQKRG